MKRMNSQSSSLGSLLNLRFFTFTGIDEAESEKKPKDESLAKKEKLVNFFSNESSGLEIITTIEEDLDSYAKKLLRIAFKNDDSYVISDSHSTFVFEGHKLLRAISSSSKHSNLHKIFLFELTS